MSRRTLRQQRAIWRFHCASTLSIQILVPSDFLTCTARSFVAFCRQHVDWIVGWGLSARLTARGAVVAVDGSAQRHSLLKVLSRVRQVKWDSDAHRLASSRRWTMDLDSVQDTKKLAGHGRRRQPGGWNHEGGQLWGRARKNGVVDWAGS